MGKNINSFDNISSEDELLEEKGFGANNSDKSGYESDTFNSQNEEEGGELSLEELSEKEEKEESGDNWDDKDEI